jgi:ribose transport system ATP-binding protein
LPGELHVVVGENGAGKSTLIKAIAGATHPDEGEILFNGTAIQQTSVRRRKELGLQVIYQELSLVPTLSVMQNIFLGAEITWGPGLGRQFRLRDRKEMHDRCVALLKRLNIKLDPHALVSNLPVSQKQLVEIAKAVAFETKVVVMDEPTTSLGPDEKRRLFQLIAELKAGGIAIVFISHIIEDCIALGDRITVLRDGHRMATLSRQEADPAKLIRLMTGRTFSERYPEVKSSAGRALLRVENLSRGSVFCDVSFDLHEGEILGFAGLVGAGRTDLMRAIAGLDPVDRGQVIIEGKHLRSDRPRSALKHGIAMLTEDRKAQGILPNLDVQTNIAATAMNLRHTTASKRLTFVGAVIRTARLSAFALEKIASLKIRARSPQQKIAHLSGGNQQKTLLIRALAADAKVLILDEPTKGIDAGAKLEIYEILGELAAKGLAVIVVSSETPEVLAVCSRILVMNRGRIAANLPREKATEESIVTYATSRRESIQESA